VSVRAVEPAVAEMTGAEALPRANGEMIFTAPWESRAFAAAVALHTAGVYPWERFRVRLIEQIAQGPPSGGDRYYERWLAALEAVLAAEGLVTAEELRQRMDELAVHDEHDHH
jgi:nitrile hydratase accessory protein